MAKKKTSKKQTSVATEVKETEIPVDIKAVETPIAPPNFEMEPEEYTMIEKWQTVKYGDVAVRPYFERANENLGLENYGMTLFDGVYHQEQLSCLEINGVKRYITGLNEFAPEVKGLPKEEREAKIKEIRQAVAQLEAELAQNIIDPEDPNFWNEVKLLRPDNDKLWSKITIRCGNEPLYLDPAKDAYDLIKIFAIEAGGFSIVAKNLEDARSKIRPPKFYLDKIEDSVSTRTQDAKVRNRAIAALSNLFDSNQTKLFYIAKVVDSNSTQYIKSTPNDIIYEMMDGYIHGQGIERDVKRAASNFLKVSKESLENLKLKAIIKDATQSKYLVDRSGWIHDSDSNMKLGKTTSEVLAYLKSPLNDEITTNLVRKVEKIWNR